MLRYRGKLPFDYSLCAMTVTVYHREGLTRQVMEGVHFESTRQEITEQAVSREENSFLLVVPYENGLRPGDKVVPGLGAEMASWTDVEGFTVRSVKHQHLQGRFCHTEVRG